MKEVQPNIFAGISCCGMGVALTYSSGQKLSNMLLNNEDTTEVTVVNEEHRARL